MHLFKRLAQNGCGFCAMLCKRGHTLPNCSLSNAIAGYMDSTPSIIVHWITLRPAL
jgi:hypothetical protein